MRPRPACPMPTNEAASQPLQGHSAEPMSLEQAMAEAARCLSTHDCQGCELCQILCPDLAITKHPETGKPVIDLAYCKGCGLCAEVCPKGAIKMVAEQEAD
jgi:2-oxoacid:acceptor oxidoreductase delta subunit (pyruvate/2-ketoisovalerate family)